MKNRYLKIRLLDRRSTRHNRPWCVFLYSNCSVMKKFFPTKAQACAYIRAALKACKQNAEARDWSPGAATVSYTMPALIELALLRLGFSIDDAGTLAAGSVGSLAGVTGLRPVELVKMGLQEINSTSNANS